jgi:hypothetical protein
MPMLVAAALLLAATQGFHKPEVIRWGAGTAQLQAHLKPLCPQLRTRRIDPPFLDHVKTEQLQIDCDGFRFFGKGRHVEFVIRDGRLVMVWLMVDASEAPGFIVAMSQAYGRPTATNARYIAFEQNRAAWRHKPAEILFYSPELEREVTSWFK